MENNIMETTQEKQSETLADILAGSFETRERQGGGTFHALKDDAPEWVGDAVRQAHGDRLPCDWIYKQCDYIASDIRQAIVNGDCEADGLADYIEVEADVYTASLTAWLADDIRNIEYCDQWADDMGGNDDFATMISGGQYLAKQEIASVVLSAFINQLEKETA